MGLRQQILELFEPGVKISTQQLYAKFPKQKKTTVRGRLYDCLGKSVKRIGKGLYVSATSIVEFNDARKAIDRMIEEEDKFDFIMLDIPYHAKGQYGGANKKKNFFPLDKITPAEFNTFLRKCTKVLRNEDSYICFMFTSGKTSEPRFRKYSKAFFNCNLQLCAQGSYEKFWATGRRMNIGKYDMPEEYIMIYNQSGKFDKQNIPLKFSLTVDLSYPTAKPYIMIKSLVKSFTKKFDWVFDPFVGSGTILKVCQELGRFCHVIDSSPISIYKHTLPIIKPV